MPPAAHHFFAPHAEIRHFPAAADRVDATQQADECNGGGQNGGRDYSGADINIYGHNGLLTWFIFVGDEIFQCADTFDSHFYFVAIHYWTDPSGSSGQDQIAWFQGHH